MLFFYLCIYPVDLSLIAKLVPLPHGSITGNWRTNSPFQYSRNSIWILPAHCKSHKSPQYLDGDWWWVGGENSTTSRHAASYAPTPTPRPAPHWLKLIDVRTLIGWNSLHSFDYIRLLMKISHTSKWINGRSGIKLNERDDSVKAETEQTRAWWMRSRDRRRK